MQLHFDGCSVYGQHTTDNSVLKQNTVFVLGAGASAPYGFPTGSQLSAQICSADTIAALANDRYYSKQDVKEFIRAFEQSGQPSIDAFLERLPHFEPIGKLAIAYYLCKQETPETLSSYSTRDNWYRALWREMTVDSDNLGASAARVSFITFNYDRSLEQFLFKAARNTFDKVNDERALQFVRQLPIVHIYGALGKFDYRLDPAFGLRPYESTSDPVHLGIAAGGIQLIPAGRLDTKPFEAARKVFEHAEIICFLGFGFDQTNVERLGLDSVLTWNADRKRPMPRIVMSRLGKTSKQVELILRELCPSVAEYVEKYDKTNLETLAESGLVR